MAISMLINFQKKDRKPANNDEILRKYTHQVGDTLVGDTRSKLF